MTTTIQLKLRLLVFCSAALAAVFLPTQFVAAKQDGAIAPKVYGWWTQTSTGVFALPEPDVPEGGMLVENAPTGPISISALKFSLDNRVVPEKLRVSVSGTPVITQPPVACLATTAFKPAEGGAWQDGPAYDCAHWVPGVVNADQTQIRFAVGRLAKRRSVSVVILAGGTTDRIAFAKPGPKTLSLRVKTTSSTSSSQPPPTKSPPQEPPAPSDQGVGCCAAGEGTVPPIRDRRAAPAHRRSHKEASPSLVTQPDALPARLEASDRGDSTRRTFGTAFGVTLLLLSILYWSDGYGSLGLRSSLASRYHDVDLEDFLMHGQAWMTPVAVPTEEKQATEKASSDFGVGRQGIEP